MVRWKMRKKFFGPDQPKNPNNFELGKLGNNLLFSDFRAENHSSTGQSHEIGFSTVDTIFRCFWYELGNRQVSFVFICFSKDENGQQSRSRRSQGVGCLRRELWQSTWLRACLLAMIRTSNPSSFLASLGLVQLANFVWQKSDNTLSLGPEFYLRRSLSVELGFRPPSRANDGTGGETTILSSGSLTKSGRRSPASCWRRPFRRYPCAYRHKMNFFSLPSAKICSVMDPIAICCVAIIIVLILLILTFTYKLTFGRGKKRPRVAAAVNNNRAQQPPPRVAPIVVGGRRQAAAAAVRRRPVAAAAAAGPAARRSPNDDSDDDNYDEDGGGGNSFDPDELMYGADGTKLGKKKAAKLQAKAEKRQQREAEMEDREDRRRREAEKAESAKKRDEEEKRRELLAEEQERKRKEEQEKRDYEEYLQMKQAFEVEQEGFDVDESTDAENMLQEFVEFIKKTKVVNMDELAAKYKLRTQDVVERLKTLLAEKILTGVMDDRGKFIFITEQELQSVAKFINQRGRVSVSELVDYSNKLIDLEPLLSSLDNNIEKNLIETSG